MKRTLIAAAAMVLVGGNAYAVNDFVDTAQVVSATPIIDRVPESRQECENVPAPEKKNSIAAPIIGGILGGLLGHQVGRGRGNTAATIAGAAGGAVAGGMIGNRPGKPEQQCRTVQSMREVVRGYDVVYNYNGRDVKIELPYNPGSTVKVGVAAMLDEKALNAMQDPGRDGPPPPERQVRRGRGGPPPQMEESVDDYRNRPPREDYGSAPPERPPYADPASDTAPRDSAPRGNGRRGATFL